MVWLGEDTTLSSHVVIMYLRLILKWVNVIKLIWSLGWYDEFECYSDAVGLYI
jgi:hypothetical protein